MNRIARKHVVCMIFSLGLFMLFMFSEMLRLIIMEMTSNSYTLFSILMFFGMVFEVVPIFLMSMWFINPLIVKNLFAAFGLAEESLVKKQ